MLPSSRNDSISFAHRALRAALTGAVVLAVGACAAGPSAADPFQPRSAFEGEVLLTVQNHDFRDATIYAYWRGVKDRVGMVIGKTTKTFTMRWRAEEVRLEIDFVGGGGHFTETIPVWAGDHLEYMIPVSGSPP